MAGGDSIRFEAMKVNSSVLVAKEMDDKDDKIDGDKAGKELKKLRSEEIIRDIEVEPYKEDMETMIIIDCETLGKVMIQFLLTIPSEYVSFRRMLFKGR